MEKVWGSWVGVWDTQKGNQERVYYEASYHRRLLELNPTGKPWKLRQNWHLRSIPTSNVRELGDLCTDSQESLVEGRSCGHGWTGLAGLWRKALRHKNAETDSKNLTEHTELCLILRATPWQCLCMTSRWPEPSQVKTQYIPYVTSM